MATTSGSGSGPDGDGDRPDFSGGSDGPLSDEHPTVVTPNPPPDPPSASPSDDVLPEFQTRAQRRQAAQTFYDLLVLQNRGYVRLDQSAGAYEDLEITPRGPMLGPSS